MARTTKASLLKEVRGAVGKQFVVKQYADKTVISSYPDMSGIKKSRLQKKKQSVFKDAVAYAQAIVRNPVKKKAYAKKLKKGERVYNAAIKEYMRKNVSREA